MHTGVLCLSACVHCVVCVVGSAHISVLHLCVLNISRRASMFVCLSLLMSMLVGLRVPICTFSKIVLCLHARKVLLHRAESSAHLYLLFSTVS